MYAQHHDGVEEVPAAVLGTAENAQAPVHSLEIWEEGRHPAPPSPSFLIQINEEENQLGDFDHTDDAPSVDWIDLPLDMFRIILDRLGAFDILSFPLVCRPWAEVYTENRRLQPGAPTLLTSPSEGGWEIPDDWERGLFFINNILSRELFSVEVEALRYERWIGGKDEWLVTTGQAGNFFKLLNPITGYYIHLPDNLQKCPWVDRVQLCRTPTQAEPHDYFAIAISARMLAYTMAGNYHWITLENPDEPWLIYSDAIMYGDKIIAMCRNGNLWSWDLDEGGENPMLLLRSCVDTRTQGWEQFDFILAPSVNRNILIVSAHGEYAPRRWGNRRSCHSSSHLNFLVDGAVIHEVDMDTQSIEEIRDIGDQALFLGPNYPFYVPVSLPSGDLKRNHVYIADVSDDDAIAIDLSLEDLPDNVSLINYSGPEDNYQVPMWFRPAFP
ncbi:hypothetical protein QYE76_060978 [Lolium multiflorum]|uniref:F-box domain-containing protein n=1 Tax=Lolium multiflorum TaxID=4521 RepID=A0AAD8W4T3_LOLMU|nr:hypothetical protein QYE76_060978 [Lolium multiflorum]